MASAIVQGKRRLVSPAESLTSESSAVLVAESLVKVKPLPTKLAGVMKSQAQVQRVKSTDEKRITRSQLGDEDSAGEGPPLYLPANTHILLTRTAPPHLLHHPIILASNSTSGAVGENVIPMITATPTFKSIDPVQIYGRTKHGAHAEVDTLDANYHKLHRYPEMLEKRGARLERERLINERSKVILEIEEMRGRSFAYSPGQGGKGEIERNKKLKGCEEKLARYDALLPAQARKSNFNTASRANSPLSRAPSIDESTSGRTLKVTFKRSVPPPTASTSKIKLKLHHRAAPPPPPPPQASRAVTWSESKFDYYSDEAGELTTDDEAVYLSRLAPSSCSTSYQSHHRHRTTARLSNSFFHSEALRLSVLAPAPKSGRRSSTVVYAFGTPFPARAVEKFQEFVLIGGDVEEDDDARETHGGGRVGEKGRSRKLEEMVQERHTQSALLPFAESNGSSKRRGVSAGAVTGSKSGTSMRMYEAPSERVVLGEWTARSARFVHTFLTPIDVPVAAGATGQSESKTKTVKKAKKSKRIREEEEGEEEEGW